MMCPVCGSELIEKKVRGYSVDLLCNTCKSMFDSSMLNFIENWRSKNEKKENEET